MSERYGKLQQQRARLAIRAEVYSDVLRGLTHPQTMWVEHIQIQGHHTFGSEATVLVKAETREQAAFVFGLFPPVGLDIVELRDGGRAIVPNSTVMPGHIVRNRQTIVPFTYSVVQTRKVVRHTLTWIHLLSNGIRATIECDIHSDRAAFIFEHLDDTAHNQVLFRRMPNEYVPEGPRRELRGVEWSPIKDVAASLTVWWPWTHPKIETRRAVEKGWPCSNEQLACILLEAREEAHGQ